MRYAILSDIHANLEAFEAVLRDIESKDVDNIVCLGDVVGYNANPNECIDLLCEKQIRTVMGNHDSRAASIKEPIGFNSRALDAILWTRNKVTPESIEFMKNLETVMNVDERFFIVHGSVESYDEYIYTGEAAAWNFRLLHDLDGPDICFFGHTHIPSAYVAGDGTSRAIDLVDKVFEITLRHDHRYLINPGSVGQPRDGDNRAAYLIYDTERDTVSFLRTEYDVQAAVSKLEAAWLPPSLAKRLLEGW